MTVTTQETLTVTADASNVEFNDLMNRQPARFEKISGGNHVLVEVSPDIHICGFCKQQYNNFEVFLAHKQNGCQIPSTDISAPNAGSSLTDSGPEFVFEEAFQACVVKVVKKTLNNAQKAPSKKLKPALTSKRHSCCFSGCTFKTQYGQKDMERHLKTHTGEKPYECELCHKRFSRRDKLNMHSRLHTGEKPHKCKYCAYAAADSSSLKKHLRIHYDERPFKCQICPYASRNSSQLTVHLRSHTGDSPFQCNQCTSKFKINSDLKRHVRIHSGEKPYKCEMCEYRCAMKGNLKPHMQLKHGAENSLRCSDCEFRCATKAALRQHSRQHQPAQPIQCPGCSYSCSSRAALKTHERVHSDERPFRCERCSFASKQRSNLLIHRRKCHSDAAAEKSGGGAGGKGAAGEDLPSRPVGSRYRARLEAARAFRCEACDASFVREDSLRSHRRQHQDQSLQQPPPAQPQTAAAVAPPPPPQAALAAGQLSSYSGAHLKIIIASPLGQDGAAFVPRAKVGAVLLSPEGGHDVLLGPAMQPVNLLTPARHAGPPAGPPAGGALVHQAVLVTHIAPEDGNTLQHQALLQTAEAASQTTGGGGQTFITTCSDLDGLSQLIQEGGTEVTVVTEGNPPVATAASSSSSGPSFSPPPLDVVSPSSSSRDSAKPADPVTLDNGVPGEDGGLVMSDMGPHRTLLIHRVPLVISAQERQAALNPLSPHSIFSDTHTADATED